MVDFPIKSSNDIRAPGSAPVVEAAARLLVLTEFCGADFFEEAGACSGFADELRGIVQRNRSKKRNCAQRVLDVEGRLQNQRRTSQRGLNNSSWNFGLVHIESGFSIDSRKLTRRQDRVWLQRPTIQVNHFVGIEC